MVRMSFKFDSWWGHQNDKILFFTTKEEDE